jgi:hypothetical protein
LASTTSNGVAPLGRLPSRARTRRATAFRRALAAVASTAIGSVSTPNARGRAQLDCGDREDPRAAPDVQHPRAGQGTPVGQILDRGEAEPGRRVQSRPECHARVERQDHVAG